MDLQYFPSEPSFISNEKKSNQKPKFEKEMWEWLKASILAGVLVLVIRLFLFSPFIVDGISMQPTLETGERLIVNKFIFHLRQPAYGDVIVFHAPEGKDYIKRVIGVAGDRVKVEGDQLFINGNEVKEPQLNKVLDQAHLEGRLYNVINFPESIVPENTIFAMGDNRSNSKDSRNNEVGFIPLEKIVGRAEVIFWPLNQINLVHRLF
jgi:signal peptidase I